MCVGDAALPGDPSTKVQRDKPSQSRVAFDLQPSTLVQTLAVLSKETSQWGTVAVSDSRGESMGTSLEPQPLGKVLGVASVSLAPERQRQEDSWSLLVLEAQ